jgi:MFS family permease
MLRLRNEPAFVRWAVAEGVSMVGSAVSMVVLPLIVYEATGSAAQTGLLFAIRVVPYLVFGAIAGPLADRGNRRLLIIGGNVAEGLLIATIPIAESFGALTMAQIYVVGLLSATAFVFSDAAVFGAVPALVGRERLAAANGFLGSLSSGAEIAGPALGGVLAATMGPTNAIWVDAFSFLVAAAVQATIRSRFREAPATAPVHVSMTDQVRRALSFVRRQRTVLTLLLVGFGNSFAFGAVLGLVVPYAVEQLDLAGADGRIGVLYSAGGVGSLLAGLLLARLFRIERVKWLIPGTLACSSLLIVGLVASTSFVSALALMTAFSWSIATTIAVGITYRQLVAPDDLRSSVNVLGRMIAWGGQPFGAAIGGLVAVAMSVRAAYVVAALVMVASAITASVLLRPWTALVAPFASAGSLASERPAE